MIRVIRGRRIGTEFDKYNDVEGDRAYVAPCGALLISKVTPIGYQIVCGFAAGVWSAFDIIEDHEPYVKPNDQRKEP